LSALWEGALTVETAEVVTKGKFAALAGVTPARLSQWIAAGQIHGKALVGRGHRARIRVSVAQAQLKRTLDPIQHLGANGRARLGSEAADGIEGSVESEIKLQRLQQLELSNAKAREEAAIRSGRYLEADAVRQEMGRIAGRMAVLFEAGLVEMATAIAAKSNLPARDVLHILRTTFRTIRERASKVEAEVAGALPPLVDDGVVLP
jgi:hypothetical protein